ncbi:hypothetical protein [Acinetobacter sp.]|uniref:hypothetical protein n=1 Tax=Acinetobacter sp. TaxID=472 RepID=UPI0035B000D8
MLKKTRITALYFSLLTFSAHNYADAPSESDNLQQSTFYKSCSEATMAQLNKVETFHQEFLGGESDCIMIDDTHVLLATSQAVHDDSFETTAYDLRVRLINIQNNKIITQTLRPKHLNSRVEERETIFFDKAHFSTLAGQHVIGIRHSWEDFDGFNSTSEYIDLVHLKPNHTMRFVLQGLPMRETFYAKGECPSNQATWGAEINSLLILDKKISHGLQDLIFKQRYTHNEAHKESGCKPTKSVHNESFRISFNGQEYPFDPVDFNQIDVI